ncbi:coronin-7 isoform X1 [Procambarus clarkii]|uniref:coronin-7 isoform X6 n=1 Tax=Procambarus clarkii TaxID=6728 RepID=UPI001E672082|nr:coronin-7-like isoform X1 [Procambarus clarkii]XP_045608197.1 coronin-7-like isoform X1 [Procambarus clarkii]
MAWRFKVSKYKNAAPLLPKKEDWVSDIKVGAPQSCGNHIKASAAFIAFNVENRGGGSLGLVPLDYRGRVDSSTPLIHGHSDLITDFDFSPFDDGMLATCSTDANVRVWHIPEAGLTESLANADYSLPQFDKRVENVLFHPTAEFLLTVAYFDTVKLWDIKHEKEIFSFSGHEDQVQNTSWHGNGSLFVTTSKDRTIRVIDPRADKVAYEAESHKSPKDSRVEWLGQTDRVLSTGWDGSRIREVRIRDLRNFSKPYKIQGFDSSTGILMPLFDSDTNMLFLAGKADVSIMYWEVTEKDPFLTEGLKHNGSVQTKGACLVPKRGLDVMTGEVNRLLQLTSNAIIPITYQVPRKTYREFHADIFPETPGYEPSTTISQWLGGTNSPVKSISLDPAKRPTPKFQIHRGPLYERVEHKPVEVDVPVPAPRSWISNGTENKPMSEVRPTLSKPMVAVKPSFMPAKPSPMPKPAVRSSFPLQENKNLTNEDDPSADAPVKNNLAQLRKNFETNKEDTDGSVGGKCIDSEEETKPRGISISQLRKTYEAKEEPQEISEELEEDSTSKLACIRKAFESRSISMDEKMTDRRREEVRQEKTIQEEEKENVGEPVTLHDGSRVIAAERRRTFEQRMATVDEKPASPTPRRATVTRSFRRVCKFRHLKGTPGHKSTCIENLRDLSRTTPGECDGMAANSEFVVLPLSGPGGKLSVLKHSKAGRQPDGVVPSLLNTANVMDFAFDPFNDHTLAVACDDGKINLWHIPEGGLSHPTNEPNETFMDIGSADKVTILKWHPLSAGILAAASGDHSIKIWDLHSQSVAITLASHPDQIFSMAWSPCGRYLATMCRDSHIRIYDPRHCAEPIQTGNGPVGVRGARVLWALGGKYLVTVGFSKVSERQISVYKATELSKAANTVGIDISPAMLIPFYDPDSSTLFATGKGDSTIYAYEIGTDFPHLFPLSHHKSGSVHQGLVMLPKIMCDVRQVEFCKALRLTSSILEPLSFTVPRVKTELFQDDIFPPTFVSWEPVMTAAEWLGNTNRPPRTLSLQPTDMLTLSESREQQSPVSQPNSGGHIRHETPPFLKGMVPSEVRQTQHKNLNVPEEVLETQSRLEESMSQQMNEVSKTLEQDRMEGVDSTEWED